MNDSLSFDNKERRNSLDKYSVGNMQSETTSLSELSIEALHLCSNKYQESEKSSIPLLLITPVQICDMIKMIIIILTILIISRIDQSQVYHFIHAQPFIKIYVVFQIVNIFDILWSSAGIEIVDTTMRWVYNSKS